MSSPQYSSSEIPVIIHLYQSIFPISSDIFGILRKSGLSYGTRHSRPCQHIDPASRIAIAGVGVALALRTALIKHDLPGRIVLLGTPAEEEGAGKVVLIERGAYEDMDVCMMCHPSPGRRWALGLDRVWRSQGSMWNTLGTRELNALCGCHFVLELIWLL